MYKVFVENRPIIICEKNTFPQESKILFAEKVRSFEQDVFPLFAKNSPKTPIILLTKHPKQEFNRLFEKHAVINASGGIVRKGDQYLFIKRFGKWDIPKGKLELFEEPKVGAIREIEEECGITNLHLESLICETLHTYRVKNKNTLKKTYWYSLTYNGNEELTPQKNEGITKAKWFKREKLDKIRSNTYESILDVMESYFGPIEHQIPEKKIK